MRIVVAGGTGFVGRELTRELRLRGHDVVAMSRHPKGARQVFGDIADEGSLRDALAGADVAGYLVHSLDRADFEQYDADGARRFAAAATGAGVRRVVYLGGLFPDGEQLSVDLSGGSARPVLSAAPGVADGVVLATGDFSFAVTHTGRVHPIRPGCRADSGYVDARGTLFVTCGDSSGATALGDADHHRLLFRVPTADRFRDDSGAGMRFFEPGRELLTNPNAEDAK